MLTASLAEAALWRGAPVEAGGVMAKQKAPKRFKHGDKLMTEAEARAWCPNPKFFKRATKRMKMGEVEQTLLRNIDEIRQQLWVLERLALRQHAGRHLKRCLITDANLLHNWRVGMNIMSGGLGQANLWEE